MEEEIKTQVEKIKDLSDEINNFEQRPQTEEQAEKIKTDASNKQAEKKASKPFAQWPVFGWFLNSKSSGGLIGKIILLLAIPYVYLFAMAAIFDTAKIYSAAPFILYSSIVFWVINIIFAVWAIVRFCKKG